MCTLWPNHQQWISIGSQFAPSTDKQVLNTCASTPKLYTSRTHNNTVAISKFHSLFFGLPWNTNFHKMAISLMINFKHIIHFLMIFIWIKYGEEARRCSGTVLASNFWGRVWMSGRAIHLGKLVVTFRCLVVYSVVCTGFLHL